MMSSVGSEPGEVQEMRPVSRPSGDSEEVAHREGRVWCQPRRRNARLRDEGSGRANLCRFDEAGRGKRGPKKNEQIPLFFPLLAYLPCSGETAITALNLLFCLLEPAGGI